MDSHLIFCGSLTNLTDGSMASSLGERGRSLARMLAIFVREYPKASLRREPQPQAIGHDGHGADTSEPKYGEPQQALRQRSRLLLSWHQ
jgi:hypothetical protein